LRAIGLGGQIGDRGSARIGVRRGVVAGGGITVLPGTVTVAVLTKLADDDGETVAISV
jgi:hypothetical protein